MKTPFFFSEHDHRVHATDISEGMQTKLASKVGMKGLESLVTHERCSFTQLDRLQQRGPYDLIFSNFAGLNCTGELDKVLRSLPSLLKKNGSATLVLLPKFCLWETLLVFKGKFRTAFRRSFSSKGVKAHVEGEYFTCWYYNPSYVLKHSKNQFDLVKLEGLCTIVPPSYIEHFGARYPKTFNFLKKMENKYASAWPWKLIGDYYIITIRKR